MGQIRFRALLRAPRLAEAPSEVVTKRRNSIIGASRKKTYRGIKKSIKTQKDFDQKIGKPVVDTQQSLINPDFVSRSEVTKKDIIHKTQDSTEKAFPQYKQGLKRYYESEDLQKVNQALDGFVENYLKYTVPLRGYKKKKKQIKGLVYLGIMALTGDKYFKKFLKDTDIIFIGQPICVTAPAKKSKFRNDLTKKLLRSGRDIIKSGYHHVIIRKRNAVLNQLVEKYRLPEIAPFSPAPNEVSRLDDDLSIIKNPALVCWRLRRLFSLPISL